MRMVSDQIFATLDEVSRKFDVCPVPPGSEVARWLDAIRSGTDVALLLVFLDWLDEHVPGAEYRTPAARAEASPESVRHMFKEAGIGGSVANFAAAEFSRSFYTDGVPLPTKLDYARASCITRAMWKLFPALYDPSAAAVRAKMREQGFFRQLLPPEGP
jgi:hypothetical protein